MTWRGLVISNLRNGVWEGKRIIPSSWVDRAQEGKVPATFGFHYANLCWSLPEKGAYMALGRHWQLILVILNWMWSPS